jgi:hypothetical protein
MHSTFSALRITATLVAAFCATSGAAEAQWAAVSLHPVGQSASVGAGGTAAQQTGAVLGIGGFGIPHAARWQGSSTWVDLHPAGATSSECLGAASTTMQGGYAKFAGAEHAALWLGSAASFIDLHPSGYAESRVWGMSGDTQVGYAVDAFGGVVACLWKGSAGSFTPLVATNGFSVALGAGGNQQCGAIDFPGNVSQACYWTGSAASVVLLNPPGIGKARAWGTDGVTQVGHILTPGLQDHAVLWSGSAASCVDLDPVGSTYSRAFAVDGNEQVGVAGIPPAFNHAALWSGTAASFVDLHKALPSNYVSSEAHAIWHAAGRTYVLGTATDGTLGRTEAMLWWSLASANYCTGKANSLGCTPVISLVGSPSATANNSCRIDVTNLFNHKNGTWIYGANGRATTPFFGGTLCVAAPLQYAFVTTAGGSFPPHMDCTGNISLSFAAYRDGLLGGHPAAFLKTPGTIVDCQFWARDPGFPSGTDAQLTGGLELEIGP